MIDLEPPLPIRGPECPPAEELEQLLTSQPGAPAVGTHAETCEQCGRYVTALKDARAAFQRQRPADQFVRKLRRRDEAVPRSRFSWSLWPGLVLAMVLVLIALVGPRPSISSDVVAMKGGAFSAVVLRVGHSTPELVTEGMQLAQGDALRFFYRAPAAGYVAILDLDAKNRATVLYPPGGSDMAPLEAARRDALPGSAVLDAARGAERVVAVYAAERYALTPLLETLQQTGANDPLPHFCRGCEAHALRFNKE